MKKNYMKTEIETKFRQFQPMIESFVWKYSRRYRNLEYSDIQSQAYLIFCKTVDSFNPTISTFSTYLYSRLRGLNNYCKTMTRRNHLEYLDIVEKYDFNKFCNTIELIDNSLELSNDARKVLNYLLKRYWDYPGNERSKPGLFTVYRWYHYMYNWSYGRVKVAWEELELWWKKN